MADDQVHEDADELEGAPQEAPQDGVFEDDQEYVFKKSEGPDRLRELIREWDADEILRPVLRDAGSKKLLRLQRQMEEQQMGLAEQLEQTRAEAAAAARERDEVKDRLEKAERAQFEAWNRNLTPEQRGQVALNPEYQRRLAQYQNQPRPLPTPVEVEINAKMRSLFDRAYASGVHADRLKVVDGWRQQGVFRQGNVSALDEYERIRLQLENDMQVAKQLRAQELEMDDDPPTAPQQMQVAREPEPVAAAPRGNAKLAGGGPVENTRRSTGGRGKKPWSQYIGNGDRIRQEFGSFDAFNKAVTNGEFDMNA